MWSDQSHFREKALSVQKELLQRCAASKSRKEIIAILDSAPSLRDREDGPIVGDDWSIITGLLRLEQPHLRGVPDNRGKRVLRSLQPVDIRKNYSSLGPFNPSPDTPWNYHGYSRHRCLDMTRLNEYGVKAWSEWARREGVRYSGRQGYILPGKKSIEKWKKADFKTAKERGLVPSGKRSPEAAIRRAAKRRLSKSDRVLRKGALAVPLFIERPVLELPSRSSRDLRKDWFSKSSGMRWSEYRSTVVVDNITVIGIQKGRRTPAPDIVLEAIKRIYANPVRVYAPKGIHIPIPSPQGFRWRVPEPPRVRSVPFRNENLHQANRKARVTESDGIVTLSYLGGQTTQLTSYDNRS